MKKQPKNIPDRGHGTEFPFERSLLEVLTRTSRSYSTPVDFFFRTDKVDTLNPGLRELAEIFVGVGIPLHLHLSPETLTGEAEEYIRDLKTDYPRLVAIGQYGGAAERAERRRERRSATRGNKEQADQFLEIARGKDILISKFGTSFFPAFAPPANVYNRDTLLSLRELGFKVISAGGGRIGLNGYDLVEISPSVDTHRTDVPDRMKKPAHLLFDIGSALLHRPMVGILLHPDQMASGDFEFLRFFLSILKNHPEIIYPTFEDICSWFGASVGILQF